MLELVFVIVVVGILAAALIPRMDRDTLYEATEHLLSHIKYTQHLALIDNVYDANNVNWFQNRWRITLDSTNSQYAISKGVTTNGVYAQDPLKHVAMNGMAGDNDYDLNDKYSVTINAGGGVNTTKLAFDNLGRPYLFTAANPTTPTLYLLTANFDINVSDGTETATIRMRPETGYAYICWPGDTCP